jgi:hypothetical protein
MGQESRIPMFVRTERSRSGQQLRICRPSVFACHFGFRIGSLVPLAQRHHGSQFGQILVELVLLSTASGISMWADS